MCKIPWCVAFSATREGRLFLQIWPFTAMNIRPKAMIICKSRLIFGPILNNPLKELPKTIFAKVAKCCQIWPHWLLDYFCSQIRNLCRSGHPGEKYIRDVELGSGAGGTVFLARDRRDACNRVAIKIIDMKKQNKGLILMEISVRALL